MPAPDALQYLKAKIWASCSCAPMEKMRGSRVFMILGNQRWRLKRSCMKPEPSSAGVRPPTSRGWEGVKWRSSSQGSPAGGPGMSERGTVDMLDGRQNSLYARCSSCPQAPGAGETRGLCDL